MAQVFTHRGFVARDAWRHGPAGGGAALRDVASRARAHDVVGVGHQGRI